MADMTTHNPAKEANKMSIGECRVASSLFTKLCDRSTYDWTGAQVQHVLAMSVAVFVVAVGALAMGIPSVQAGTLNILNGGKKDFFDWEYAKKVWSEMNTWDAEEREWAKYSADFEPWLEIWKKDRNHAKKVLETYPEQKRRNIQRAFDIQLAWDTWYDEHYLPWINDNKTVVQVKSSMGLMEMKSFKERQASYNALQKKLGRLDCIPQKFLDECGPMPDWRSPEMKTEEMKLEARRAELLGHSEVRSEQKNLKSLHDGLK
jgi:hypothetical protein